MARRAFVWLLPTFLALVLAFGAASAWPGPDKAGATSGATSLAQDIEQPVNDHVLTNGPLDGGNAAASAGQWNDNDDPDDILQASVAGISPPALISGVGRRVGHAVVCQHLVSSAFPRGPPAA